MFVFTIRSSTIKFCATLLVGVLLVAGVVFFLPEGQVLDVGAVDGTVRYDGVSDHEDMAAFLLQFGWQVSKSPITDETVTLPQKAEGIFAAYNELQKGQGLDLSPYGGKRVRRVVFNVLNYPDAKGQVVATLFIYRNTVVAGDVSSGAPDGFVCGFDGEKS
ncbi:MAG: DUF4830 domain-containing protein [Clostridia bacterium]|nr:DUF4830 domain-containing protein [Clostridia bacterium]